MKKNILIPYDYMIMMAILKVKETLKDLNENSKILYTSLPNDSFI